MAIQAGYVGTSNGWQIGTTGHPDVSRRPKLEVSYTTDPIGTVTLRQGVNGYTGTTMAWLRQDNNINNPIDGSVLNQAFLDGPASNSPDDRALIKFDNIFASQGGSVPDGAEIVDAFLVISTGFDSANARSVDAGTSTP